MPCHALESILESLGRRGRYQTYQYCAVLLTLVSSVWQMFVSIFITRQVVPTCSPVHSSALDQLFGQLPGTLGQKDVAYDSCSVSLVGAVHSPATTSVNCPHGYDYQSKKDMSVVSEWDLVCGDSFIASMTQAIFIASQGVGAVIFTIISDRTGRKPVLISVLAITLFLAVGVGFSASAPAFIVLRSVLGAVSEGAYLVSITLVLELSIAGNRLNIFVLYASAWGISALTLAPVGYFLRNSSWRTIQFVSSSVGVIVLVQLWTVDESIRWLVSNRRHQDAASLIRKVAKINKIDLCVLVAKLHHKRAECKISDHLTVKHTAEDEAVNIASGSNETRTNDVTAIHHNTESSIPGEQTPSKRVGAEIAVVSLKADQLELESNSPDVTNLSCTDEDIILQLKTQPKQKTNSYCAMISSKHICVNTTVLWTLWLFTSLGYYLFFYTNESLTSDLYLTYLLASVSEFPAIIFVWLLLDRIGRRLTLIVFSLLGAAASIVATLLKQFLAGGAVADLSAIVIGLLGKIGISTSYYVIVFYTIELYPTPIRNIGIGSSALFARIGGILATFGNTLHAKWPWSVGSLVGGLGVAIALLALALPETARTALPHTVEDVDRLYDKHSTDE